MGAVMNRRPTLSLRGGRRAFVDASHELDATLPLTVVDGGVGNPDASATAYCR